MTSTSNIPSAKTQVRIRHSIKKKRWWGEARNARRRERYHNDPEYRARIQEQARKKFLERGTPKESLRLHGIKDKISSYGKVREVTMEDGAVKSMMVLTSEELANVLGKTPNMVYRWRSSKKLPYGVMTAVEGRAVVTVYSEAEVYAMVSVLADHFGRRLYYHDSHEETRKALFTAVDKARRSLINAPRNK